MNRSSKEHVKVAMLPTGMQVLSYEYCLEIVVPLLEEQISCSEQDLSLVIGALKNNLSPSAAVRPPLPPSSKYREFEWAAIEAGEAELAMIFAGHRNWVPATNEYLIPDDSISHFSDCAYWIIVGESLTTPVLPIYPVITVPHEFK